MQPDKLRKGDILFLIDKHTSVPRHVSVCIEVSDNIENIRISHILGLAEPFAFVSSTFLRSSMLEENNFSYEVIRIKDDEISRKSLTTTNNWLEWAIPYSVSLRESVHKAFLKLAESKGYKNVEALTLEEQKELIQTSLEQYKAAFKKNLNWVIACATRSEITPVLQHQLMPRHL